MTTRKELIKYFAVGLGLVALGLILLLTICPRILTGSYADITITDVSRNKDGPYSLEFSSLTAPGTTVITGFYDGNKYEGGGNGGNDGYLGWPANGSAVVMFTLDPESLTQGLPRTPRPDN